MVHLQQMTELSSMYTYMNAYLKNTTEKPQGKYNFIGNKFYYNNPNNNTSFIINSNHRFI